MLDPHAGQLPHSQWAAYLATAVPVVLKRPLAAQPDWPPHLPTWILAGAGGMAIGSVRGELVQLGNASMIKVCWSVCVVRCPSCVTTTHGMAPFAVICGYLF